MLPQTIETILDRVLLQVEKPGRYVGGEYNSVVKDWNTVDFKVALAFPDIYDLGMSNLGLMLLDGRARWNGRSTLGTFLFGVVQNLARNQGRLAARRAAVRISRRCVRWGTILSSISGQACSALLAGIPKTVPARLRTF